MGLVLIDPAHEDRLFTMLNGEAVAIASPDGGTVALDVHARSTCAKSHGVRRRRERHSISLPPDLYKTRIALDERLIASYPDTVPFEVVVQSAEAERAGLSQLLQERHAQAHPLGDRPVGDPVARA